MGVIGRWERRLAVEGVLALVLLGAVPLSADAAAFRGTIVDAETGQPLQGVVIFAAWFRRYTGIVHGWVGNDYYASEETVSGPDGKFVLKDHSTWTFLPFVTKIDGPEFMIFKAGYGQWRFHGSQTWPVSTSDAYVRQALVDEAWKRFRSSGVTLELPPLRTREERLGALPRRPYGVPGARMETVLGAINRERIALDLEPVSPSEERSRDANR